MQGVDTAIICDQHRGYAVVCLSPVIEAVGVTSITPPPLTHTRGENYAHNIIHMATSLINYHYYMRLTPID